MKTDVVDTHLKVLTEVRLISIHYILAYFCGEININLYTPLIWCYVRLIGKYMFFLFVFFLISPIKRIVVLKRIPLQIII